MKTIHKNLWILTALVLFFGITSKAQDDWTVDPYQYLYSMTISGQINIDGKISANENDKVAAFIDGTCRGVASPNKQKDNSYFVFLMVFSNEPSGTITFKIYDAESDSVYSSPDTLGFEMNGIVGSKTDPFSFSATTGDFRAEMLSLSIPDQIGRTRFLGTSVYVTMPYGSSLSGLVASFTLSPGAKAYVNGVEQISGSTANRFWETVRYKVVGANPMQSKYYNVHATPVTNRLSNLELSSNSVPENRDSVLIGSLSAVSSLTGMNITFSLKEASVGDFFITGNNLYNKTAFNYEQVKISTVVIVAEDGDGNKIEKSFEINVVDQNDAPSGIRLSRETVSEATSVNSLVSKINVLDEDAGDLHRIELAAGNGQNDKWNTFFKISGDSLLLRQKLSKENQAEISIYLMATDSGGLLVKQEFKLKVVDINLPPEFMSSPPNFVVQNQMYIYALECMDSEGDELSFSFVDLPGWLKLNAKANLLTGVPGNAQVGEHSFEIKVSDGQKETVQNVYITVLNVNDAPEIKNYIEPQHFVINKENEFKIPIDAIIDPDPDDVLTFSLSMENNSALPSWLTFDPAMRMLTGNPPAEAKGEYSLKLKATDTGNLKEWMVFQLLVILPTSSNDLHEAQEFSVYPNPVQNKLHLTVPNGAENAKISLANSIGQIVKTVELSPGSRQSVQMGDVLAGIYFISLVQDGKKQTIKLIKN